MGATEIIFIFVIYLLLFGAKGIPTLAQTMGKAVRQFREASSDIQREILNSSQEIQREVNKTTANITEKKESSETPPPPQNTPEQ
jgi:sec-independent protein translocase protein TatA